MPLSTSRTTLARALLGFLASVLSVHAEGELVRLAYNRPDATADLGVGLWGWPFPVDRNQDGKPDLIVVGGGKLGGGAYYFENTGRRDETGAEVFRPAVRLGSGAHDLTPSYLPDGSMRVIGSGRHFPDFLQSGADQPAPFPAHNRLVHKSGGRLRGAQYSLVDFHGRGVRDLIVGIGDWSDYGWDNAYDANGRWTNGPLHGYVYLLPNTGDDRSPVYGAPQLLEAAGRPIDLYGMPSPVFADFRGTGKLDLICGEFIDGLTFFENIGTRTEPRYAAGRRLRDREGRPLTMPLNMIVVVAYDWNSDGRPDLVIGQEDGRVAVLENTGRLDSIALPVVGDKPAETVRVPAFSAPRFFRQEADRVKFGALSSPFIADWDGDGRNDIVTGNSAGEIAWIRNLGGTPPRWAEPEKLAVKGQPIRFMAGPNGSIQGPAENKWGYTNLSVADWDGDRRSDILVSDITGRVHWIKNLGGRAPGKAPQLAAPAPIQVWWDGKLADKPAWNWWSPVDDELVVQWRCTPLLITLPGETAPSLVTLDPRGFLVAYRQEIRDGERRVLPAAHVFETAAGPLRITSRQAGRSGRRTFAFTDWDGDGRVDMLLNGTQTHLYRNISTRPGAWRFAEPTPIHTQKLEGHSTTPAIGDLDGDGAPDLLIGAEDGFFYQLNAKFGPTTAN